MPSTRMPITELAARIRAARARAGLSQEGVAVRTGVSLRTYARWESGESEPSATGLANLADSLRVTADHLLGRSEVQHSFAPTLWVLDLEPLSAVAQLQP